MDQRQTGTRDKHGPETNMDQRKNMELRKILSRDQDWINLNNSTGKLGTKQTLIFFLIKNI